MPIEAVSTSPNIKPKLRRLQRESYWIDQLQTVMPHGLNIQHDNQIIPFVTTFDSTATKASIIVKRHYSELQNKFPHVYTKRLVVAYKRNKNLSDFLVHGRLEPLTNAHS